MTSVVSSPAAGVATRRNHRSRPPASAMANPQWISEISRNGRSESQKAGAISTG
ncbi:MAG: hypothetical protein ACYSUF_05520 [Planctomycetota bacterium]|jgi:hypothetical protein